MHYTKLIDGNKIFTDVHKKNTSLIILVLSRQWSGSKENLKKKKVVTLWQIYDFALIFKYGDPTELRKCNKVQINM